MEVGFGSQSFKVSISNPSIFALALGMFSIIFFSLMTLLWAYLAIIYSGIPQFAFFLLSLGYVYFTINLVIKTKEQYGEWKRVANLEYTAKVYQNKILSYVEARHVIEVSDAHLSYLRRNPTKKEEEKINAFVSKVLDIRDNAFRNPLPKSKTK